MPDAHTLSPPVTRADLRASARRELALRREVYPGMVQRGRLHPAEAQHELRCQDELVRLLDRLGDAPLPEALQADLFASPPE